MRISQAARGHHLTRFGAPLIGAGIVIAALVMTSSPAVGAAGSASSRAGSGASDRRAVAAGKPTLIATAQKGKLGRILVNSSGRTLYLFTRDPRGKTACTGSCQGTWVPVLGASVAAAPGSGLTARLVGTTTRPGGDRQATYNHHPLYRFAGDKTTKATKGEGADQFGGYWYVVNVHGNQVRPKDSGPCGAVCSGY